MTTHATSNATEIQYQGTVMEIPPQKAKRQGANTKTKKAKRGFSSNRVKMEHRIDAMKRFAIAGQRWQNLRNTRTIIIKNVVGLANWAAA